MGGEKSTVGDVQGTGPLEGVRVIDMTTVLMAPLATQHLGDLGADVIKIEAPKGDSTRTIGPGGDALMGPIFLNTNRNKRSVVLDLKREQGRTALLRLVETADVVTYNIRPAAMQRLGLGYEAMAEVNPRVVYVGMFGFSQRGRYAPEPAFDDLIQAAAGLTQAMGRSGETEPRYVPSNLADRSVGLYAFGVIASALFARERTGRGQRIDVPMFETMVPYLLGDHFYGEKFVPARGGFGYPRLLSSARKPFRTSDGYICTMIYQEHQWRGFLTVIGRPEMMQDDPRLSCHQARIENSQSLNLFIQTEIAKRTSAEWKHLLTSVDIAVFPALDFAGLLDDPHLREIGFFREVEHPRMGTIREMAVPSEWHGTVPENYRPPPALGEHSVAVLREAGYSETDLAELIAQGVTSDGARADKLGV